MHLFGSVLDAVVFAAGTTSKAKTSAGNVLFTYLFLALVGFVAWRFFFRPRSQQAKRQRDLLQELSAGDEVLTGAGIFGTVLDVEADRVTLETAPGTRITVLRSTIARRLNEPPPEDSWHDEEREGVHWDTSDGDGSQGELDPGPSSPASGEADGDEGDHGSGKAAGGTS